MKAVIQRITEALVSVTGKVIGAVDFGLLVYLGVAHEDTREDADWIAEKTVNLRVFDDSEGKMNLSLLEIAANLENNQGNDENDNLNDYQVNKENINRKNVRGNNDDVNPNNGKGNVGVLVISQFTLLGDARKGRRPSWSKAAAPEKARELYLYFIEKIKETGLVCESGEFQARMEVSYTNDGPVTILLDSAEVRSKNFTTEDTENTEY
jgi:D-tyrosyl-tRNA(Tyr) deacylase